MNKIISPAVVSSSDARKKTNKHMQKLQNILAGYEQVKPTKPQSVKKGSSNGSR